VTGQLQNTGQTGTVQDHGIGFRWTVKNQPWSEDTSSQMILATVTVTYPVQGRNYAVNLSTLIAPVQQISSTSISTGVY
jgi:hypothetical protein